MIACAVAILGMQVPLAVWTELLLQRACERMGLPYPSTACDRRGQDELTLRSSWLTLAQTVPAVFSVGAVSSIADTYGRRIAIILTFVSPLVYCLSVALTPPVVGGVDGYWIILTLTALSSFTGGSAATFSCAMSVIADVSDGLPATARTTLFMLLEAAMWGGAVLGPIVGGKAAEVLGNHNHEGLRLSFFVGAAFIAFGAIILWCFYEETLKCRRPFRWDTANPISQLAPLFCHPVMRRFAVYLAFVNLSAVMQGAIINNYFVRVADLDVMELSTALSINMGATVVGLLVGLPILQRCLSTKGVICLSVLDSCIQQALLGLLALPFWQSFIRQASGSSSDGTGSFGSTGSDVSHPWRYLGPYVLQAAAFAQVLAMPCMRSTIAMLCGTNQVRYTVANTLGAVGAMQALSAVGGPILGPGIWSVASLLSHLSFLYVCVRP
jgi:MFS family permease